MKRGSHRNDFSMARLLIVWPGNNNHHRTDRQVWQVKWITSFRESTEGSMTKTGHPAAGQERDAVADDDKKSANEAAAIHEGAAARRL
jgi:hypothetical protein